MTSFNPGDYFPKPRDWFQPRLSFQGLGTATFCVPEGELRGTARINLPAQGSAFLQIAVEQLIAAVNYDFSLGVVSFLGSEIPVEEGSAIVYRPQLQANPCASVTICSDEGLFFSDDVRVYGFHTANDQIVLDMSPHNLFFERWGARGIPTYWVAPLTNLKTEFPIAPEHLRTHPLRLKLIKEVTDTTDRTDWQWKWLAANQSNRLFAFENNGDPFYVEPLPGFEHAREHSSNIEVTAIAVGELRGRPLRTHRDLTAWFPFDLLTPLGFGTGTEVGIPWFEVRNERGELMTRLHLTVGHAGERKGDPVFTSHHLGGGRSGLPELVEKYLALSPQRQRVIGTAMRLFVRGTPGSGHVEENLMDVMRAFDALAGHYNLDRLELISSLSSENKSRLSRILNNARTEISALRKTNRESAALDQDRILERVQSRLANVSSAENDFGASVIALTKKFELPDADILDQEYIPTTYGGQTWASVLSELRGATIHEGRIEFEQRYNILEVFKLLRHLHDVLARIILKECGYTGTYQTHLIGTTNAEPVNWVQPNFSATKLRF